MTFTLAVFCLLIVIASLVGGWLPSTIRMTHLRMQLILSLVAGVMLGVATMHLLPHAAIQLGSFETPMAIALGGILFMFFMNRILHFHQHGVAEDFSDSPDHDHSAAPHACEHHSHQHELDIHEGQDISSIGLFVGMAIHTLIDGAALAAAATSEGQGHWTAAGFTVFLAILLHKPLDSMSITSLMKARKWNDAQITVANLVFSLLAPLGALLFIVGLRGAGGVESIYVGAALAFSAGVFLCISLGDLLPEVHYHKHDRVWLSGVLIIGILIAVGIELLPGHQHLPIDSSPDVATPVGDSD